MNIQNYYNGQNPLKQILFKTIQDELQVSPFETAILPAYSKVMEFAQGIIEQLENSGQTPPISCKAGCSYCCHSQVKIIPIEALSIHTHITNTFNDLEVSDLKKRISSFQLLSKGKTFEQRFSMKEKLPCIFLMSGKCSIYKSRPSICRSWNSLDHLDCKIAYNSEDSQTEIQSSPARNYVYGSARELFELIARQLSLQTQISHMHKAITDCFNATDPLKQWCLGTEIFNL